MDEFVIVEVSFKQSVGNEKLDTGGKNTLSIFEVVDTQPLVPVTVSDTE